MMIIDRIEENTVVLEYGDEVIGVDIKKFTLPVKEGDVVVEENGLYKADPEATRKRREDIIEKMKKLGLK